MSEENGQNVTSNGANTEAQETRPLWIHQSVLICYAGKDTPKYMAIFYEDHDEISEKFKHRPFIAVIDGRAETRVYAVDVHAPRTKDYINTLFSRQKVKMMFIDKKDIFMFTLLWPKLKSDRKPY